MTALHIGLPALRGTIENYKSRFDLVELRPVDTPLPKTSMLRRWRASTPAPFVFSIVLPRAVSEIGPASDAEAALEASLEVARVLEARCIVLQTPSSVRPTATNRKRIAALMARLPAEGVVRCWEPQGVWERAEVVALAREMDAIAVLDAATEQPAPGPIVYTRLRALGKTAALSASLIERMAERLRNRREAYVVVEQASDAKRIRAALGEALSQRAPSRPVSLVVRPSSSAILVAEDEEQ